MAAPLRLDRMLIRVSGPEARRFLQDVLTQDLAQIGDNGVCYAALLSPQGKVIADMFVWGDGEGLTLDCDPTRGGDLMRRVGMYKLRAQATLREARDVAVAWSPLAFDGAAADPRLPALGGRKLVSADEHLPSGQHAYDAHRLVLGVPDLASDAAPDEVFAGEALLEELNGVDFQKGCFVGQENVSRMKRRATTRKKFCPIVFEGQPPAFGAAIHAGEAEIGSVRTGAPGRAIALIRLDRAQGQALAVEGRPVRLDPPPWLILASSADAP